MNHSEAAISGLYDHEQEAERQHERHAPDWGADELFSSTPRRRRFDRDRERLRGAGAERPRLRDTSEHRLRQPSRPAAARRPLDDPLARAAAERADRRAAGAAELAAAADGPAAAPERPAERAPEPVAGGAEVTVAANGRRTVLVTGRPDAQVQRAPRPLDAPRRRPAPTLDQYLGHRPDRLAGWAFGLGLLLIVVAALTAG
ncbi:MAG TPA: hypothetical protein VM266_05200 [Solirubrobacteraceae bacterium]|nr:hypothetical protein [Solirubrobacteraceae bacterium]